MLCKTKIKTKMNCTTKMALVDGWVLNEENVWDKILSIASAIVFVVENDLCLT